MPTVIVHHDVKDKDHWLASSTREEFFARNHYRGVVGISAHLFVDGVDAGPREAALKAWLDGVYV